MVDVRESGNNICEDCDVEVIKRYNNNISHIHYNAYGN